MVGIKKTNGERARESEKKYKEPYSELDGTTIMKPNPNPKKIIDRSIDKGEDEGEGEREREREL